MWDHHLFEEARASSYRIRTIFITITITASVRAYDEGSKNIKTVRSMIRSDSIRDLRARRRGPSRLDGTAIVDDFAVT